MRCLVTGVSGFIGSYLAEFLLAKGAQVYGLSRQRISLFADWSAAFHFVQADILDRSRLSAAIATIQPDLVFHLAAQSLPVLSWQDPETTFRVNVFGTLNLFDAIRAAGINPIIQVFSSSSIYATSLGCVPIREDYPTEPSSPYALSKIAQDQLCVMYGHAFRLRVLRVRPFFIIGPRKTGDVCSDFARGIVAVERGLADALTVGNIDAMRDFLDIRDAMNACWTVIQQGQPGEVYNICSGQGYAIRDILHMFAVISTRPVSVREDPARLRPLDEPIKVGDNQKMQALGWKPTISIDQALRDILTFWRSHD